ncbi:T9SS type A sorting domain-containing protein [Psychroserpens sp. SPM9]|uniref:T9SS type A sorting domain-containing protein n=1 Tax=Psychroserpens sp. SPM9 TaxID=2975598 RepID=UPI0021A78FE7|nr:T9SS type A sorting domain-containing protein [Psychroserpens sp. SPM9]MDG5491489.1 T9SS type A sorting domain-containing protein [Psychroserpens sp. SPM9]
MKHKLLVLFFFGLLLMQAQTPVDCASGFISDTYCYGDDESTEFIYTSTDGSPLQLTFNTGEIEGEPYDYLIVRDTDGTQLYNGEGNNGVLNGLVFESTGDTISFQIISDGSISCTSGDFPDEIGFTVACLTSCASPQANFTVINDCDNGDQFLIDVEVNSLGDASSVTLSNNIDATTVAISSIGTYQIGPFPFAVEVVATLQSDQDGNCFALSDSIEVVTCPPDNNAPCYATDITGFQEGCDLFTSATMYGSTNSNVVLPDCINQVYGDVWYQFTAFNESLYVSLLNYGDGIYRFNQTIYEGTCDNLTEIACETNPQVYLSNLTIGNTYFIRVYYTVNWSETSTFDICIDSAPSNTVCDAAVPFCSGDGVLTTQNVVGVDGMNGVACLDSAPNPSWSIIKIDEPGLIEVEIAQGNDSFDMDVDFVLWGPFESAEEGCSLFDIGCPTPGDCPNNTIDQGFYPSGNIIDCSYSPNSIENFTIANAQEGEIYLLLVTNFSGFEGNITITQTNLGDNDAGSISSNYEVDLGEDLIVCDTENSVLLEAVVDYADTYDWYRDGFIIASGGERTFVATQSGVYSVITYNENCDSVSIDDVLVSFVTCENLGLIEVSAFYDVNENGIKDANEINFTNGYFTYELNDDTVLNSVSSSTGNFTIISDEDTNTYDINYYLYSEYDDCYTITSSMFEDVSVLIGETMTVEFPIVNQQQCEDIGVLLINSESPRPGFVHTNYLVISNLGQTSTSGTVDFVLDPNLTIESVNTNPNYTINVSATGFTLDFTNLPIGESYTATIALLTPANVELGELVTNTATYTTTVNDAVNDNNSSSITEEVIGSYDPNDKMESHGRSIDYNSFISSDEFLYYTIRFQNIGTAEAINIRIEDLIDTQLDETTFQMLRSSHDYIVTRTENNLEWYFEGINLPAEQNDAEGSQGFVYFKIKPKAGYAIGDVITNTASIFFDFNAAIVTNTFESEFVEENLSVSESSVRLFDMFPNPANDKVTIQLNASNFETAIIHVTDIQGKRIIETQSSEANLIDLDVSDLQNGLYFVRVKSEGKTAVKKLIIE